MTKEKFIEFLFNDGKKYRVQKFIFLIMFSIVVFYLPFAFHVSPHVIFVPVLLLVLIMSVLKMLWYNKKKNIKTSVHDWGGFVITLIVLLVMLFQLITEIKLENAVHEVIEEKVEGKTFTIDFVEEVEFKEEFIIVGYTVKGEHTQYLEWYYWKGGELVHDLTRKSEDNN